MNCYKCKGQITPGQEKKVADWDFCEDCFQELLNKPAKKAEEQEPVSDPKLEIILCHLCKKEITDDTCKKTGIWRFCHDCHASLNFSSKQKSDSEQEEKELSPEQANRGTPEINLNPKYDFMKSDQCEGCGREIPVGGGRDADGKNLCPECFYAMPDHDKSS